MGASAGKGEISDRLDITVDDSGNVQVGVIFLGGVGHSGGEGHVDEDGSVQVHSRDYPSSCSGEGAAPWVFDGRIVETAGAQPRMSLAGLDNPCSGRNEGCKSSLSCSLQRVWRPARPPSRSPGS